MRELTMRHVGQPLVARYTRMIGWRYVAEVLLNVPALYMPLWETSGTTAENLIAGTNGTYTGGFTLAAGTPMKTGLAAGISLDGVSGSYVSVADHAGIRLTSDLCISAWVNPTSFAAARGIVGRTTLGIAAPYDYYLDITTGLPTLVRGNGTLSANIAGTAAPLTGLWSHVAVTMSGTTVTHYLNGQINGSGTLSTTIADGGGTLRIGSRADNGTLWLGGIGQVAVYGSTFNISRVYRQWAAGAGA